MPAYPRAHVVKRHLFELDGVDYSNQLQTVLLTPNSETQSYRIAVPDGNVTDNDSATWTIQLIGIQDFGTGSLGAALRAGNGLDMDFVYEPNVTDNGGDDHVEGVMKGAPIPIGGTAGQFRTFDMSFGVSGEPLVTQSPVIP
jgi:hypothetical protein